MYAISFEDFDKYYSGCKDFDYIEIPELGILCFYRKLQNGNNELVAIDDGDKYYCKYLYWKVQ